MKLSVDLLPEVMLKRANVDVPATIIKVKEALKEKDFEKLAPLIMSESDYLHDICA